VAPVFGLGLPGALLYFLAKSPERIRKTLVETLLVISVTASFFAFFFLLGGAEYVATKFDNPRLANILKWFAFYPLIILPTGLVAPLLVANDQVKYVTGFSIYSSLIRLIAVVLPVYFIAREPLYAVQGLLVGGIAVAIPALLLIRRSATGGEYGFDMTNVRMMLAYAIPLSVGTIIGTLNKGMDKLLVSLFASPAEFAVFVNGAMEIPLIGVVTGAAAQVMLPEITRLFNNGKRVEAIELFRRSATKCGLILIPCGGMLFALAPELMVLLYGDRFLESSLFFRFYLVLIPLRVAMYGVLFQAAGRTDLVMKRALANLVINTALSVLLLKLFGPVGAVIGTLASMLFFVFPYCILSCSRLFGVSPSYLLDYKKLFLIFAPIGTGVSFSMLLDFNDFWMSLVAKAAVMLGVSVPSILSYRKFTTV